MSSAGGRSSPRVTLRAGPLPPDGCLSPKPHPARLANVPAGLTGSRGWRLARSRGCPRWATPRSHPTPAGTSDIGRVEGRTPSLHAVQCLSRGAGTPTIHGVPDRAGDGTARNRPGRRPRSAGPSSVRWGARYVEVDDTPAMVGEHDEDKEHPQARGGHREEIEGEDVPDMVGEERARRGCAPLREQARDGALGDIDPELEEL